MEANKNLNDLDISEEEVDDILEGTEPGARYCGNCHNLFILNLRNLDETLFAADSFEDLTSEVEATKLDGQCSSRTFSLSSSSSGLKRNDSIQNSPPSGEDVDTNSYTSDDAAKVDEENAQEEAVDEARLKRAESIIQPDRQSSVEEMTDPQWKRHKKHVFILSEAGKPIYTRYGNEENLVTMMGLMQAIVSFVQDAQDNIRCINAGDHKFVFLVRGPIILVAVCSSIESHAQLVLQLTYVYHQVLSVLTFTQLTKIFETRRNYDLRKLLAGTEKFIDNLLNLMSHDPSFLLQAVRCLPLSNTVRDAIGQSLQNAKCKDLVFAILVIKNQLVTMVRPKKFSLHPSDLHLIFNLVSGSTAFKTAESWTPICLPRFDNSGYLYAHVSYLDDDCPACLLLLSTDRNAFFTLSECKTKILERLGRYKCLDHLTRAAERGDYGIDKVGISELWHFVYKSRSTAQFTSPKMCHPYASMEEQERLFGLYMYLHNRIHSSSRPLKILCYSTKLEMILGWVTSGFELYASFSPLTNKATAINAVNRLLRWIKKEEDVLFIINSYTF